MQGERRAGGGRNRVGRPVQVVLDLPGREEHQVAVPVAVHAHGVPRRDHLGRQSRGRLHLLADQEERGAGARLAQGLQHGRRPREVGAVVEREPDVGSRGGGVFLSCSIQRFDEREGRGGIMPHRP